MMSDCFSIGVWVFIQNVNFFSLQQSWRAGVHLLQFLKYSNLQSHYTFFRMPQIPSVIVPILYNKPYIYTGD